MFTKIMAGLAVAEAMVVRMAVAFWTWRIESARGQVEHLQTCLRGLEDFAARQWAAKEESVKEVVEMLARLEEVDRDVRGGGGWTPDLARAAATATAAQAEALKEVAEALSKWAHATETAAAFREEISRESDRVAEMTRHLEGWTERLPPLPSPEEGYW